MRGEPRYLATRADYEYMKDNFPDEWQARWQDLLDTRFAWLPVRELAESEAGITDDTHRVVEHTDEAEVVIARWQEAYVLDQGCKLLRIGLTVEEVQTALEE